jgi:Tfp pilus assembly protein PilW
MHMTTAQDRTRSRGITTIELMAGTALSLILLSSIVTFQQAQLKANATQSLYSESQNITRTAIDLMSRELRMAAYDPKGTAIVPLSPGPTCPGVVQGIVSATPTSIRFQQDLNNDGAIGAAGEDVTYALSNGDLTRKDGASAAVSVVTGLGSSGLSFRYFDGSNPPIELVPAGTPPALNQGQRACVNKIRMVVSASIANPYNASLPLLSSAESEVAIRNRSLTCCF